MKKLFLFLAVVAAFSFASCKKDRTCTCTDSSTSTQTVVVDWQTSPTTTSTTVTPGSDVSTTTFLAAKKGDAKKACVNTSTEYNDVSTSSGSIYNPTSGTIESYTTTNTIKNTTGSTCSLK